MSRRPKILRQSRSNFRTSPRDGADSLKRVVDPNRMDLACKYFVSDLPGAILPGTRLNNILEDLEQGRELKELAQMYLQKQELSALQLLARGEVTYDAFCKAALNEKTKREQEVEAKRQKEEAERLRMIEACKAREAIRKAKAEEERRKLEKDPKYIAKMKNQQLRMRYGLDYFIERQFFARLMHILRHIDAGHRFSAEDILWLTTEGDDYYTKELQTVFHDREARYYANEYKRTNDLWNVVNASSHYRKCNKAEKAHNLLNSAPSSQNRSPRLNSAICTTHGGVMRDLNRFDEALKFGHQAHSLTPKDFRPCTLLGAVNFEMGNFEIGKDWYDKAMERGASERSIDQDLRSILLHTSKAKREKIKAFLLREDSERYKWVRNIKD